MSAYLIRLECLGDEPGIATLITRAFADAEHSDGTEAAIVDRLRDNRDLELSLVAEETGAIIGHAAFSRVTISDGSEGWFGLGPVAVEPARQGQGTGSALIRHGRDLLAANGARGVVVLGDPDYYASFGFEHDPRLSYPGPPPEYFQRLVLAGDPPVGTVRYAPAFG